jgi:hypothetical protein
MMATLPTSSACGPTPSIRLVEQLSSGPSLIKIIVRVWGVAEAYIFTLLRARVQSSTQEIPNRVTFFSMHIFKLAASFAALAAPALAAVAPLIKVEKFDGETTGRYIIHLKDGVTKSSLFAGISQATACGKVSHEWSIFNGFASPST